MHSPSPRNALITGGAIRIGRAIALRLAEEGWDIAIHYRSSKRQADILARDIGKLGRKVVLIQADLSQADAPEQIVRTARSKLGPLACLINNASRFEKDRLATFSEDSLRAHFDINTFAPLRLIRHFAAQCPKKGDNVVINIGDGMPGWSISPNFLSYALSKLTLMQMAPLLAAELAPHIRINTIAPGATLPSRAEEEGTFAKLKKTLPLKRISSTQEVCDAVSFLTRAPSVTGQCIFLGSGAHLFVPNT